MFGMPKRKRKAKVKRKRKFHWRVTFHPRKGKGKTFRRKFRTEATATKFIRGRVNKTKPGDIYSVAQTPTHPI